ncbi:MAG TPA: AraC family transcriptional regulator [Pyrinomonadaceae bacterium]|nr:AraC family transcriptional regulator [Pyrinomonadaceae bacterium]
MAACQTPQTSLSRMQAHLDTIYESSFGRILDFKCRNSEAGKSAPEYVDSFSINFTRRGSFGYSVGSRAFDVHSGVILFEQAGSERVVSHGHSPTRDECTSLELTDSFFEELKEQWERTGFDEGCGIAPGTRGGGVAVFPLTPGLEYLHASLFNAARAKATASRLQTDVLLVALLQEIGQVFAKREAGDRFDEKLKERHLDTIDRAKSFIIANFQRELSLEVIARHARVSVFHFSRLFKHFTSLSPYQYLIDVRLRHAALLLRHTSLSVTEICYDAGFNSFEHFIATFKQNYSSSPLRFRHRQQPPAVVSEKQDS